MLQIDAKNLTSCKDNASGDQWLLQYKDNPGTLIDWLERIPESPQEKKIGGKNLFKRDLAIQICTRWARTGNLTETAEHFGIERRNLYNWRRKRADFAAMFSLTQWFLSYAKENNPQFKRVRISRKECPPMSRSVERILGLRKPQGLEKYSPEVFDKISPSVRNTAEAVGVTQKTVYRWMDRYPEFKQRMDLEYVKSKLPELAEETESLVSKGKELGFI